MKPAITVDNVSKIYKLYNREIDRLFEGICRGKKQFHRSFAALDSVSFSVPQGTTFGILGRNGSGKSTLLQIIAGVLRPSAGEVSASGRISALLELGSGFDLNFTGRENVFLYGHILGLTEKEIKTRYDSILDFADIGDFIDQPLRTYSSGMIVRLAFATAVAVDPEILIVDEALAVGDAFFQHKCILKIKEIIKSGTTVLFVSHDVQTVKTLCTEAILLEHGKNVLYGSAEEVANTYHRRLFEAEQQKGVTGKGAMLPVESFSASTQNKTVLSLNTFVEDPSFATRISNQRFGNQQAQIVNIQTLGWDDAGTTLIERHSFVYGEKIAVRLHCKFAQDLETAVIGFILRDQKGVDLIGTNTLLEKTLIRDVRANELMIIDFLIPNLLCPGSYSLSPAITEERFFHQAYYCDWINNALVFNVVTPPETIVYGVFYPTDVTVSIWRSNQSSDSTEDINTKLTCHN